MSTIVVAIDFSVSDDRALRRAVIQARSINAGLVLVHVEPDSEPGQLHSQEALARAALLKELARAVNEHDGVACESVISAGTMAEQVALIAEERSANLITVGRHERGLRDLVAKPATEEISRRARIPTLIANSLPLGPYTHILLGTRLDEPSAELARWLAGNPLGGAPELSMLYVHDPHTILPVAGDVRASPEAPRADEELGLAQKALDEFLVGNGLAERVYPRVRLQRGPVSLELDEYASELGCDLVAIAGSEKPFLERLVTGSVAQDVLREIGKDILVCPPGILASGDDGGNG